MTRLAGLIVVLLAAANAGLAQNAPASRSVAILTDDPQAAAPLANGLMAAEGLAIDMVGQPVFQVARGYQAVILLLDGPIRPPVVAQLEEYVKSGGRLVLLNQAIDPTRHPAEWLRFIGVKPPAGGPSNGRYRLVRHTPLHLVALTHRNFVIENKVAFTSKVAYISATREREMLLPALPFPPTTALLNVEHTRLKRYLLGVRVANGRGQVQMQDGGAWVEDVGAGQIYYFMPGDSAEDFKVSAFVQMIANAILDAR